MRTQRQSSGKEMGGASLVTQRSKNLGLLLGKPATSSHLLPRSRGSGLVMERMCAAAAEIPTKSVLEGSKHSGTCFPG